VFENLTSNACNTKNQTAEKLLKQESNSDASEQLISALLKMSVPLSADFSPLF
jgi:F0F1-type ATP synthase membrane subunit b/b'